MFGIVVFGDVVWFEFVLWRVNSVVHLHLLLGVCLRVIVVVYF